MAVEQLMADNIPFQMRDRLPNLYEHWISRDILTYLKLGMGSRRRSDFLQICNRPNRYLARDAFESAQVSFEALYDYYEGKEWMCRRIEKLEQDLQLLGRMTPFGAVNYIRFAMGYEEYLKEYAAYRRMKPEEFLNVWMNCRNFPAGIVRQKNGSGILRSTRRRWRKRHGERSRKIRRYHFHAAQRKGPGIRLCLHSRRERRGYAVSESSADGRYRGGAADVLCGYDKGEKTADALYCERAV